LIKEFSDDLEKSISEASVSPSSRLKMLLRKADSTVFKPFGIKPSQQKYFIAGSARIYLYPELVKSLNLKPIGDLDIVVPDNTYWNHVEKYIQQYPNDAVGPKEIEMKRYSPTPEEDIDVFDAWLPKYDEESTGNFEVRNTDIILKNARNLGGYYYMSFYDIIDYKFALKREKEKPIIDLLIKYKNASDSEKETIKKQVMSIVGNDSREADEFLQPAVNS
jgi:hypothetical protein